MKPLFLTLEEVLGIHRDQIERYGGLSGVHDMDLLVSALAMPAAGAGDAHFHRDLFEMAAAYLFHIVRNHPFMDGNKRVGATAAAVFLFLNGLELNAGEDEFEELVLAVARGRLDKTTVAAFFRANRSPIGSPR